MFFFFFSRYHSSSGPKSRRKEGTSAFVNHNKLNPEIFVRKVSRAATTTVQRDADDEQYAEIARYGTEKSAIPKIRDFVRGETERDRRAK